jgi:hypothetical protein
MLNGIGKYAGTAITICPQDSVDHLNFYHLSVHAAPLLPTWEPYLTIWPEYSISPGLSYCQIGFGNMLCWICSNMTQNICQSFSNASEHWSYASKCCGLATNLWAAVLDSDTADQYCPDWIWCQPGLRNQQCSNYCTKTLPICRGFWSAPESGCILYSVYCWLAHAYVASGFRCIWHLQLTNDSQPLAISISKLNSCHFSSNRSACELVLWYLHSLHLIFVLNCNNQEHCWNPTQATSDERYNNSNI